MPANQRTVTARRAESDQVLFRSHGSIGSFSQPVHCVAFPSDSKNNRVLIDHDSKTLFFHIPKCAGHSVMRFFDRKVEPRPHCTPGDWIKQDPSHADHFRDYFTFTLVRNPFTRAVSNFFYAKRQAQRLKDRGSAVTCPIRRFALEAPTFSAFVLQSDPFSLLDQIHFRPQVKWLFYCQGHPVDYDYIGRVEELPDSLEPVRAHAGLTKKVPRVNQILDNPWNAYDSPDRDEVIDRIRRWYRLDFEVLAYSQDPAA
ncbi:MAG: sulfotransferase family 2 domain-containing protein [Opitutales bacterium]